MLSFCVTSCTQKDNLNNRVSGIEDRLASIEESVGSINANAELLWRMTSGKYFLKNVRQNEFGYSLEFTDNTTCDVVFGDKAPVLQPLLSIDQQGVWLVSLDGGKEYRPIDGASSATAQDGYAPKFKVLNDIWSVSLDGGITWSDLAVSPLEAVAFFTSVAYDQETGMFTLVLSDGRVVSMQLEDAFYLKVKDYPEDGVAVSAGDTKVFKIEAHNVKDVYPQLPKGWRMTCSDTEVSFTVPSDVQAGTYEIYVTIISEKGFVKNITLKFNVVH